MNTYDVVVVGGGAAGLSAALVLGRARRRVAVVDAGEPRNAPAAHMQGFLSRDGMSPADLLEKGRAEVIGYGVDVLATRVAAITGDVPAFTVSLSDGRELRARRILVATGAGDELPDIPGLRQRWGKDVLHCPYCHGYEVRDQPLGVLGNAVGAVEHALLIRQWSDDVVLFAHTLTLTADDRERLSARGVRIVEGMVTSLILGERLRGVEVDGDVVVPRAALFLRPVNHPHDELLVKLGYHAGETDPSGLTSVPGVWAAGNVADPRMQVITSAGQGSAAAIAINADLVQEDVTTQLALGDR